MKKTLTVSKKILAAFLATLMLFGSFAVAAYAEGEVTITATPSIEKKNITATVTVPEGYAVSDAKISPEGEVALGTTITFYNLTPGKTYTITVTAKKEGEADLTGTKSVELTKSKQAAIASSDIEVVASSKTIRVEGPDGAEYSITSAASGYVASSKGSYTFSGLTDGTTYTIYARMAETDTYLASDPISVSATPRETQAMPSAVVPNDDITSTSFSVKIIPNAQYSVDGGATWQDSNEFKNLTPDTVYNVWARFKATETKSASEINKTLEVKTHKASAGKDAIPVQIENITTTKIVLKKTEGYEYSKDKGVNWQDSNEFTNLTAGTTYYMVQRVKADADAEVNKSSDMRSVSTNTEEAFLDTIDKVPAPKLKDEKFYVGEHNTIMAYSRARETGIPQWGDLQYVPLSYELTTGGTTLASGSFSYDAASKSYQSDVVPTIDGNYIINIIYTKSRYEGIDKKYVAIGQEAKSLNVTAVEKPSTFQVIFQALIKFIGTTLPQLIMKGLDMLRKMSSN